MGDVRGEEAKGGLRPAFHLEKIFALMNRVRFFLTVAAWSGSLPRKTVAEAGAALLDVCGACRI